MKTLLRRSLPLVPLVLLFVGVNAAVDPAGALRPVEREVAEAILAGRHVEHYPNLDDRLLEKLLAGGTSRPPEVLVLGSSRVMEIRAEAFPGLRFFNAAVASADLHDLAAVYELYRARGFKPARLLVGLDPWLLNGRFGGQRWRSLQDEYDAAAARIGLRRETRRPVNRVRVRKLLQLVSPSYFQQSLRSLWNGEGRPRPSDDPRGPHRMILSDGSFRGSRTYRERPEEAVRAEARAFVRSPAAFALSGFAALDPALQADLEAFLRSVIADGVQVSVLLPPYHPDAYRELQRDPACRGVAEAEAWMRGLCARLSLPVAGSYDPAKAGFAAREFYDPAHAREDAIRRLLR